MGEPEPEPEPEPEGQDDPDSDEEHNAALFERFDADKDGFLNLEECKHAATSLFPDEEWDNELWTALCEGFGADPTKGMDVSQFAAFVAQAEEDEDEESVDMETELFYRFDADADGFLSMPECKSAAKALFPEDDWDDDLWPELCSSYGADPSKGLGLEAFRAFRAAANAVATEERKETTALARAEAVGGTGWEAMNFPLHPEHLAAVSTLDHYKLEDAVSTLNSIHRRAVRCRPICCPVRSAELTSRSGAQPA
jgi:Ca2+-binding EF-hand superfamily protein